MTVVHPPPADAPTLRAEFISEYAYTRSTGPVLAAFLRALADKKIHGIRSKTAGVVVPPQEYDPATSAELTTDDLVEVADTGEVVSWTWVATPKPGNPLDTPFAFALIRLEGADTPMLHGVDVNGPDAMSTGMAVRARWADERVGDIGDIVCFEPDA
ncbi:MAG TPA: OB-fold domain-containing protein [Acidimicrobiales bacterium]|jgi:uncharacterized OB-fold protein